MVAAAAWPHGPPDTRPLTLHAAHPMREAPAPDPRTLDERRHAAQQALRDGGAPFTVGEPAASPWPPARLHALRAGDAEVLRVFDGGLTGEVLHLRSADGREWALKRARAQARVHNTDGALSFVNELLRRADFARLKAAGAPGLEAIVDTAWGSLRDGLLLSPWAPGAPVAEWDERRLAQVLQALFACSAAGLFEWDPSPGNLVDDGVQLRLFDFGYTYPFDPLTQFNSAGRGDDRPGFHPAERFETRCFFAVLLGIEQADGDAAALRAFRLEKRLALDTLQAHRAALAARGASATVLGWLDALAARWRQALRGGDADGTALGALYLAEAWRSHTVDLDDDLGGRSCTPMTLRRADWLLDALARHGDTLRAQQAFAADDAALSPGALRARYAARRDEALRWQL